MKPESTQRGRDVLHVVGAGPAGLAAAITAAKAGATVVVHEQRSEVGGRFHGDFQGLENWTSESDVLEELAAMGIDADFDAVPCREHICFGPSGREHRIRSEIPAYYLVRRGADAGTLDIALKGQALAAGVEIRFKDPVRDSALGAIVGAGPRRANVIAVGWVFRTDLADGAFGVLNDSLAAKGYAYLLVHQGRGTMAVCLYADFHREAIYLARTREFFQERLGFEMRQERRFGGAGRCVYPDSAVCGNQLLVGEAAGFQDPLWGFGIRYALLSGHFAAKAWLNGDLQEYDRLWQEKFGRQMRAGFVNRRLYEWLGNAGYGFVVRGMGGSKDPRSWLRRRYGGGWWKDRLFPIFGGAGSESAEKARCSLDGCECTMCRCGHIAGS